MTPSEIFKLSGPFIMIGWLILIGPARWMPRTFVVARVFFPATLSALYVFAIIADFPNIEGGFDTLENVARLFQNEWALLAGWVHYLAFDFFVGCWILEKARQDNIPHWIILPIFPATFLAGPVGYLLFIAVRNSKRLLPPKTAIT